MNKILISVHTPKTAGSSLLHQLKRIYGSDSIYLDYSDDPVDPLSIASMDLNSYTITQAYPNQPFKVVHGHFVPHKYHDLNNALRITFLRDPVDNVVSIYNYWRRHPRDQWENGLFRYTKDMNLSLERFVHLPTIRYLYTRTYFNHYNMRSFDFIGDYADYDNELNRLGNLLGVVFDLSVRKNVTVNILENDFGGKPVLRDVDRKYLRQVLREDVDFYNINKHK